MSYIEKNVRADEEVKQMTECFAVPPVSQTKSGQDWFDSDYHTMPTGEEYATDGYLIETNQDSFAAPYDGLAVSLETYWAEFYGQTERTYEWNNGILEAKPMAKLIQVKAYLWFLKLLRDYLFGNAIAELTLLETPFQFNIPGKTKVRIPDLAIVLNTNPVPLGLQDRTFKGIFDICIESVSDSDLSEVERDTVDKWSEYAQGGVTEYYILDEKRPLNRRCETAFYRLGPGGVYQPIQPINGVIQSSVLPGFQFRADDLEKCPGSLEMLDDPVYQFTSPLLRAERQRAERELQKIQGRAEEKLRVEKERAEEELRVEKERAEKELRVEKERAEQKLWAEQERAEQEKRVQVEKINAYLKSQGISLPDDLINISQ